MSTNVINLCDSDDEKMITVPAQNVPVVGNAQGTATSQIYLSESEDEVPDLLDETNQNLVKKEEPSVKIEEHDSEREGDSESESESDEGAVSDPKNTEESVPKDTMQEASKTEGEKAKEKKPRNKKASTGAVPDVVAENAILLMSGLEYLKRVEETVVRYQNDVLPEGFEQFFEAHFVCDQKTREELFRLFVKFSQFATCKSAENTMACASWIYMIFVHSGTVRSKVLPRGTSKIMETQVAFCELVMMLFANANPLLDIAKMRIETAFSNPKQKATKALGIKNFSTATEEEREKMNKFVATKVFLSVAKQLLDFVTFADSKGKKTFKLAGRNLTTRSFKTERKNICDAISVTDEKINFSELMGHVYRGTANFFSQRLGNVIDIGSSEYFSEEERKRSPTQKKTATGKKKGASSIKGVIHDPVINYGDLAESFKNPREAQEDSDSEDEDEDGSIYDTETNEKKVVLKNVKSEKQETETPFVKKEGEVKHMEPVKEGEKGSQTMPIDLLEEMLMNALGGEEQEDLKKVGQALGLPMLDTTKFSECKKLGNLAIGNDGRVLIGAREIIRIAGLRPMERIRYVSEMITVFNDYIADLGLPIIFSIPEPSETEESAIAYVHKFSEEEYPEGMPKFKSLSKLLKSEKGRQQFRESLFIPTFVALFMLRLMGIGNRSLSNIYVAADGMLYIFGIEVEDFVGAKEILAFSEINTGEKEVVVASKPCLTEYLLSNRLASLVTEKDAFEETFEHISFMNELLEDGETKSLLFNFMMQLGETLGIDLEDVDVPVDSKNPFWSFRRYEGMTEEMETNEETQRLGLESESFIIKCLFDYVLEEILGSRDRQEVNVNKRKHEEEDESESNKKAKTWNDSSMEN